MFDGIKFQMYGNGFRDKWPDESKALEDKQASGYLNLEHLLDVSAENSFIPSYQKVYSIYAGDTAIFNELTLEEQESNYFWS